MIGDLPSTTSGVGFVGLYGEIRTHMALAAERRVASVVEEVLRVSEPDAEVRVRADLEAVVGLGC